MRAIRRHVTFPNVVAMIALFVALGGTGYAALKLPKNSVGAKQIKANAVRSAEVRNRSLKAGDFRRGQLPIGAKGDTGAKGDKGDTGTFGPITVQYEAAAEDLPDGMSKGYVVHCPEGQRALAGGFRGDETNSEATNVGSSRPVKSTASGIHPVDNETFTGWRITVLNPAGGATTGIRPEIWVICAAT
jgi:hypothetical protein